MSTISYSRTGSGQPIVLIHGIGHRRQAWGEVPEMLAARAQAAADGAQAPPAGCRSSWDS